MTIATSSPSRKALLNGGIIISCSISWATVSVSVGVRGGGGRRREAQEIFGGHNIQ